MRTVRTKVYKFNELASAAKEKAIRDNCDINVLDNWWENTYEDALNVGIRINCFNIDRGSYCEGDLIGTAEETARLIIKEHGENCETHKTAQDYLKSRQELIDSAPVDEQGEFQDENELDNNLADLDKEFENSIFEDYLIILRNEYEYLTGDEAIQETLINCKYEFTAEGNTF